MGIFDIFTKDPTELWKKVSKLQLTLSLPDIAINKLKLGDSKEKIMKIGKPNNKKAYKNDRFEYQESGLIIETENDKINYFAVIINSDQYSDLMPAELTIENTSNQPVVINKETLRKDLISKLNLEIDETDEDDEEIIDFIKTFQYTIEIESFNSGKVKRINLYINT